MVNLLSLHSFLFFIGPSVALRAPSFAPAFCPPDSNEKFTAMDRLDSLASQETLGRVLYDILSR